VSIATVRHKINILASIWEHLICIEAVERNPWKAAQKSMKGQGEDQRRPHRAVPEEKVRELFKLRFRGSEGARDKAMLAAQFAGALRPSEMLALRLSDIKTAPTGRTALLLMHTKRQRAELQGIPAWAAEIILAYAEIRKVEGAKPTDFLFVHYTAGRVTNEPIPPRTWQNWFKRYMLEIDLDADYSPHDARATAITKLRKDGHTYEEIRHFSRHSSVVMVQQYDKFLGTEGEDLAEKLKY
jgi:integrase